MIRPTPPFDRFLKYVDASGDCWLWTGGTTKDGYGVFQVGSGKAGAHRWLWEYLVGPIPLGHQLDHRCRMPRCVNPDHLEPVTREENRRRVPNKLGYECTRGHPRTPENSKGRRRRDRKGGIYFECRQCINDRRRRAKAAKRGAS